MTADDLHRRPTGPAPGVPEPVTSLDPAEPMTDELCLFVHSLLLDDRPVPAELAERARAWAAEHPACLAAVRDFEALGQVLAEEAPTGAPGDFTERVVTAARQEAPAARVLPFVRRLSAAAALLLGLTLVFDLQTPGGVEAGDDLARQRHVVDTLRPDPFGPADVDAGLRTLLGTEPLAGEPRAEDVDAGATDAPADDPAETPADGEGER